MVGAVLFGIVWCRAAAVVVLVSWGCRSGVV